VKALTAAEDVIDYLIPSPLLKVGASNPFRDYAFQKVIRWLRLTQKGSKDADGSSSG